MKDPVLSQRPVPIHVDLYQLPGLLPWKQLAAKRQIQSHQLQLGILAFCPLDLEDDAGVVVQQDSICTRHSNTTVVLEPDPLVAVDGCPWEVAIQQPLHFPLEPQPVLLHLSLVCWLAVYRWRLRQLCHSQPLDLADDPGLREPRQSRSPGR